MDLIARWEMPTSVPVDTFAGRSSEDMFEGNLKIVLLDAGEV